MVACARRFSRIQKMHASMVMGFVRDSRHRAQSLISDSPPRIRSVSRTVEGRLAKTRQRRTLAMSLNTSRKLRPRARFKIVVPALNHSFRLWLTFPAFSKRTRVRMKRRIRTRVKSRRGIWLLRRCHDWRLGLKSADREESRRYHQYLRVVWVWGGVFKL